MAIIATPTGSPIIATGVVLPPMGLHTASIPYTIKKNSGNVVRVYNPCGYTPSAQEENHPSFGKYTRVQMAIDIPKVVLASDVPKPGDFFTGPDGNVYNVLKRQTASIFFCRVVGWCPTLSFDLQDMITIKVPTDTVGSDMSPDTAVSAGAGLSGIAAAIRQTGSEPVPYQHKRGMRKLYSIWTYQELDLLTGSVIIDQNSIEYKLIETANKTRLDELQEFKCYIDP